MRADEPRVELRPRGALEAADLGCAMLRVWWRPIASTWFALVLPLALLISVALRDSPWIAVFVLWWLRPLFARVPLHVLSRKVFGQPAGIADTLRALPQLALSGLFVSLTLLRFSPARTLLQPVLQLEGLRGRARRERSALLGGRDIGAAMGVMSVGAHISAGVILGTFFAVEILIPENVSWEFRSLFTPLFDDVRMGWAGLLLPGLYFTGVSVVEPMLVAAGFAMYLNRRVFLEGWDIEIAFRRLAERRDRVTAARATAARATAAGLIGAVALSFFAAGGARAEAADLDVCNPQDPKTANACADALIATGDFGGLREVEWWVLKQFDFDTEEDEEIDGAFEFLGPFLAGLFEFLAWTALAIGLIALAVAFARALNSGRDNASVTAAAPTRLFGLDLEPDSLPEDLVGAARSAWRAGDFIGAMSLLYRGALIHLIEVGRLAIPESATEYECVELVRSSQRGETSRAFADLTHAWVGTRYATNPPGDATFESLCEAFGRAFARAAERDDERDESSADDGVHTDAPATPPDREDNV